jgi:hypothetical protein
MFLGLLRLMNNELIRSKQELVAYKKKEKKIFKNSVNEIDNFIFSFINL